MPSGKLEDAFRQLGRDASAAALLLADFDPDRAGSITYDQFQSMLDGATAPPPAPSEEDARGRRGPAATGTGPAVTTGDDVRVASPRGSAEEDADPKVDEFLRVMDEYRAKCEGEGLYEEAGKASEQLDTIRKQEEARRVKAIRARHAMERKDVGDAHANQYTEFNTAWDKYLAEFDSMAAMYVGQMQERHGNKLKEFQEGLHADLLRRPIKFSRELLEWRTREAQLAKQRKYADAHRIKLLADDLERRERSKLEEERLSLFAQREAKFRAQQGTELSALVKRIETRRAEHVKQREVDSKRLVQRNRNVMAVLESRQVMEEQKRIAEVKMHLHPMKHSPLSAKAARPGGGASSATSPRGFAPAGFSPMTATARSAGTSPREGAAASRTPAATLSPLRASVQTRIASAATNGSGPASRRR